MDQNDFVSIDILVDKVKASDSQALWELFDYYMPVMRHTVAQAHKSYRLVEKEDLMSECVFILKYLCEKYDKNKSYFSYYLSTRMYPYLISKIKSKYVEKIETISINNVDESELSDNYFGLDFGESDDIDINDAIDKLPNNHKVAIDLFYFQGFNQLECAAILKISQPAFSKRIKKSLELLKNLLPKGYN